jgi:nucleotide-binding universal stress UspA family protein
MRLSLMARRELAMFSKILVTLDGSRASEAILQAVAQAAGPDAEVILLNVAEVPPAVGPAIRPLAVAGAPAPGGVVDMPPQKAYETRDQSISNISDRQTQYLEDAGRPLRAARLQVKAHVAFGDAAEEILAFAKREDVDVIMMATHGRSALAEILFGSVASRVLRSGLKPVMVVRPTGLN